MSVQKYTIELFAKERNLTRQAAINLLSKLKKQGLVQVQGEAPQHAGTQISWQYTGTPITCLDEPLQKTILTETG